MNGLELSRGYYEEYGRPMLEQSFPDLLDRIAVGFVGGGSEHFGFDDEISRDHDFEPGFCIFLPGEDVVDRRTKFLLERAYSKLPKEYCGIKRQLVSPVGGRRNGVMRTAEFYLNAVGASDGILSVQGWLRIPDHALAEATNGEVYFDGYGEFTAIRRRISDMPRDVRLKRLAGYVLMMAQSGQYNFLRCISHRESEAAQLACVEFVNYTMKALFALNNRYMPYYKWSFRALRGFDRDIADMLAYLLSGDNADPDVCVKKYELIEEISSAIIDKLREKGFTDAVCGDLEKHAYSINDKIEDGNLRNMHILSAV